MKLVTRVTNELLDLIDHPEKIECHRHAYCLWCGMVKAFPKKPCEICGLHGNSSTQCGKGRIVIEYFPNTTKPRRPRIVKRGKTGASSHAR